MITKSPSDVVLTGVEAVTVPLSWVTVSTQLAPGSLKASPWFNIIIASPFKVSTGKLNVTSFDTVLSFLQPGSTKIAIHSANSEIDMIDMRFIFL